MECVEYASNDFVDKIEVIAGRSRHFKLSCLIPDQKSIFRLWLALRKLE